MERMSIKAESERRGDEKKVLVPPVPQNSRTWGSHIRRSDSYQYSFSIFYGVP